MATEKELIYRDALLAEYDRVHIGEPGKARKLIAEAPTVDAVEVPCRIGDRVWVIRNFRGCPHPQEGIVSEMFFGDDMRLCIVVKNIARGEWGKAVFATKEEAEAAIGERRIDNA